MEFDLRQWLLILGPIFVIGVLLHGYLRMRASQNEIKMKLDKSFLSKPGEVTDEDEDVLNLLKAELPNGGARVIRVDRPAAEDQEPSRPVQQQASRPDSVQSNKASQPADEDVPMLMESVELPRIRATDPEPARSVATGIVAERVPTAKARPTTPATNSQTTPASSGSPGKAPPARKPATAQETRADRREESGSRQGTSSRKQEAGKASTRKPEKFVVINVLALSEPFPGQRLMEILLDAGMTFGEMNIFHRLQEDGEPMFSLANAVEPGTFEPARMDTFSSPGVTLFMRVHELADPMTVLDEMLAVADRIALDLDGELRDETRSVMTPQTIEYCRQSVREFQFRHSA
ncbi:MAG: cell division protein ZipA [Proteobacteria bacterium]|nr:cell division protein ZipA [Pseudomonadota bacterium]